MCSFQFLCWSISQTVFILAATLDLQQSSVTQRSAFKQYCTTSHTGNQHIPIPSPPCLSAIVAILFNLYICYKPHMHCDYFCISRQLSFKEK